MSPSLDSTLHHMDVLHICVGFDGLGPIEIMPSDTILYAYMQSFARFDGHTEFNIARGGCAHNAREFSVHGAVPYKSDSRSPTSF